MITKTTFIIKEIAKYIANIIVCPFIVSYYFKKIFFDDRRAIMGTSQLISLIPGSIGEILRYAIYRKILKQIGKNCSIGFGVTFSTANVILGNNITIGPGAEIGQAIIGDNALIGAKSCIMSGKRQHNQQIKNGYVELTSGSYETVRIGESTWIGAGSIIVSNVGNGCIIGAGSVVVKDVSDFSIMAGNPAKLIKSITP